MGTFPAGTGWYIQACLAAVLFMASGFAAAAESGKAARLMGVGVCSDCKNIQGLHVAVVCENGNSEYEPEAMGAVGDHGEFNVPLPSSLVNEDVSGLKKQCYAQLYATSRDTPCPTQQHLDHFKLVRTNFREDAVNLVFGTTAENISFSHAACDAKSSLFQWPCPFFKFPHYHPWKKHFPLFKLPPFPCYKPPYKPSPNPPKSKPPTYTPETPKPKKPTYAPKPKKPTYAPKPKKPTYSPKPKKPTYSPKPKKPTYSPKPEKPTYSPIPEKPTYAPIPEKPTYPPTSGYSRRPESHAI